MIDLFSFMLKLRKDPRILSQYLPELSGVVEEAEPRNLSREMKGTPDELQECVVAYGFGSPLSAVVAVAFSYNDNDETKNAKNFDLDNLKRVYGVDPLLFVIQPK